MHTTFMLTAVTASLVPAAAYLNPRTLTSTADYPDITYSDECLDGLMSMAADAPYPPSAILDWETQTQNLAVLATGGPCAIQTAIPSSLSSEWASYQSEVMSWYTANEGEISSVLAQCPTDVAASAGPCSTGVVAADATGSSGGSKSKNSGPRETGIVAGVVAAAGFVGAVAML